MKKTTRTAEEVIEEIIEFFKEETEIFNNCIEELDNYNGYLGDKRYYEMEYLNEFFADCEPTEILYRTYYGGDEDTAIVNEDGTKRYGDFNPMRELFYFNGYGNLMSSDFKNYEDFIEPYTIIEMSKNREEIESTYYNDKLTELFNELETI